MVASHYAVGGDQGNIVPDDIEGLGRLGRGMARMINPLSFIDTFISELIRQANRPGVGKV